MSDSEASMPADIVVVGAGLAGSAVAAVLARRGLAVTVVDPYTEFPSMFRAEKIEPNQADLFRRLGLFDGVEPATRLIREIIHARGGRVVYRRKIEQFGIAYCDIVNSVRSQIPAQVDFRHTRVESIAPDARRPAVVLAGGERIEGRLVVVATGMFGQLTQGLGVARDMVKEELSMVFGFMLERADGAPFAFDAVTYRPETTAEKVGYLTLFRMGQFMRGNLFTYWPLRDALTQEMRRDPVAVLGRVLPGLDAVIGRYGVAGKVEPFKIDLYRTRDPALPGVVLIGDAFQSVCPSTGMGQTKVLTDVDVLCNDCLPEWLAGDEIGPARTAAFYANPRKVDVDAFAVRTALAGRDSVMDNGLPWRIRRRIRTLRFATGW